MPNFIRRHPLTSFFILAFAITWSGSTLYILALPRGGQLLPPFMTVPTGFIWYFGPFTAALIVTWLTQGKASVGALLQRLRTWRVGWIWYAFILFYPLALHLAVVGLDWALGGPVPVFFQAEGVPPGELWLILPGLVLLHIIQRGIGEETGWRGFALPRLQSRWGALCGSLVLGALWGLWHFHPANSALFSISGFFIFVNITATSVIYTWLYNRTRGSLLIASLFHMTLNVSEFVVPIGIVQASLSRHIIQVALVVIAAAALTVIWRLRPNALPPEARDEHAL